MTRAKLVELALKEVGVREEGGNNRGTRVAEFQRATWLEVGPWPWCAALCCWLLKQWLQTPDGVVYLNGRKLNEFRCKDASAFGWIKWAQKNGLQVFDENSTTKPEPGDFVVFDFSHIGIVVGTEPGKIITVEGNTNGKGERDSTSGDGVWKKTRDIGLVRAFLRL